MRENEATTGHKQEDILDRWRSDDHPGMLMRRALRRAVLLQGPVSDRFDLPPVYIYALVCLKNYGDMRQKTLGVLMDVELSNLTSIINRLEERGLITRIAPDRAIRSRILTLTEQGHEVAERVIPLSKAAGAKFLAPLSPEAQSTFVEMLKVLADSPDSETEKDIIDINNSRLRNDLKNKPGHVLRRALQFARQCYDKILGHTGMSAQQLVVLHLVRNFPDREQKEIAALAHLDVATVGGIVKKLLHAELITRVSSGRSKRGMSLSVTSKGKEVLERDWPDMQSVDEAITSRLSKEETETLMYLLSKMAGVSNCYTEGVENGPGARLTD